MIIQQTFQCDSCTNTVQVKSSEKLAEGWADVHSKHFCPACYKTFQSVAEAMGVIEYPKKYVVQNGAVKGKPSGEVVEEKPQTRKFQIVFCRFEGKPSIITDSCTFSRAKGKGWANDMSNHERHMHPRLYAAIPADKKGSGIRVKRREEWRTARQQ